MRNNEKCLRKKLRFKKKKIIHTSMFFSIKITVLAGDQNKSYNKFIPFDLHCLHKSFYQKITLGGFFGVNTLTELKTA